MKESSLSPDLELVAVLFSIVTTARAFGIRAVAQNSDTSHVLEGGKDINNTTFMIIDWEYAGNERCCYSLPS
ncbi:hypothetical protein FF1_023641 [Malus domestica]